MANMLPTAITLLCLLFQPIIAFHQALPDPVRDVEAALIPAPTQTGRRPTFTTIDEDQTFTTLPLSFTHSPDFNGIEGFLQRYLPTGSLAILSIAAVKSKDLDAEPTLALQVPGYGNWKDSGWNLRVHGDIYKQPVISEERMIDLANRILIDTKIEELPPSESTQAANLARSILMVPQGGENVTVNIEPAAPAGPNAQSDWQWSTDHLARSDNGRR